MKLLIFDTETTGLPKSRTPALNEPNNWPHIVSISWVIMDAETNKIEKKQNYIVKPIMWTIPEESIQIHGITNESAMHHGYELMYVIGQFLGEEYDALVAHNLEFDLNVIYNAIRWDLNLPCNPFDKKMYCTMELSRYICNIPGKFRTPKSPKLSELYEYVFKRPPNRDSLHNSMYDTYILMDVIRECDVLRQKMNLPTKSVEHVRNESKKNNSGILYI